MDGQGLTHEILSQCVCNPNSGRHRKICWGTFNNYKMENKGTELARIAPGGSILNIQFRIFWGKGHVYRIDNLLQNVRSPNLMHKIKIESKENIKCMHPA